MTRILHAFGILGLLTLVMVVACSNGRAQDAPPEGDAAALDGYVAAVLAEAPPVTDVVRHTEAEWREQLTDEQYSVLREAGTERAFTGALLENHGAGVYHCAACGNPLYSSATKFDSGTGWPSFYAPIEPGRVSEIDDSSHGMVRTEIRCARCDSHLGHVFNDGPPPTGLRYCMNSAALVFHPAE